MSEPSDTGFVRTFKTSHYAHLTPRAKNNNCDMKFSPIKKEISHDKNGIFMSEEKLENNLLNLDDESDQDIVDVRCLIMS